MNKRQRLNSVSAQNPAIYWIQPFADQYLVMLFSVLDSDLCRQWVLGSIWSWKDQILTCEEKNEEYNQKEENEENKEDEEYEVGMVFFEKIQDQYRLVKIINLNEFHYVPTVQLVDSDEEDEEVKEFYNEEIPKLAKKWFKEQDVQILKGENAQKFTIHYPSLVKGRVVNEKFQVSVNHRGNKIIFYSCLEINVQNWTVELADDYEDE